MVFFPNAQKYFQCADLSLIALCVVRLSNIDRDHFPVFEPQRCATCDSAIKSSMFVSRQKLESTICEECYFLHHYGDESYTKRYKHCIISEAITPSISREICHCETVPHSDSLGEPRCLFPVEKSDKHKNYGESREARCGLLSLGQSIAMSKYSEVYGTAKTPRRRSSGDFIAPDYDSRYGVGIDLPDFPVRATKKLNSDSKPHLIDAGEAMIDDDIPLFFRRYTEKYPFWNVHMALRVGPLVLENGVSK